MFRHEDTRLTKLFVGGIPYETEDEALRAHFEQFGPINEAVVIRDRDTLKSKGYGFVTFRDKDCAEKACVNKNPKIEGRTANVNLAYIGAKPKSSKGYGKNASSGYGFSCKQNTIMGSHQFPANYTNGFPAQLPAQQIPAVPLVSPLSQSPNGQIAPIQPTVQPLQLIEYNGVPTILFGAVYDHLNYYSSPTPYIPSPTLPVNAMAPSFTYQAVAPQTPPLNTGSLNGQHFFPTHVELIGQPQI